MKRSIGKVEEDEFLVSLSTTPTVETHLQKCSGQVVDPRLILGRVLWVIFFYLLP